jgi:hypothetical protein
MGKYLKQLVHKFVVAFTRKMHFHHQLESEYSRHDVRRKKG